MSKSSRHHWWPVALQSYWADKNGDVSWVKPDGSTERKRYRNRKIAVKRHGHTMLRGGGGWETNFEPDFSIDNNVHQIVRHLRSLKPPGYLSLARKALSGNREPRDLCKFYSFSERFHRKLLLFILSLAIRSPCNRHTNETFPASFGMPVSEDVGKANIHQQYQIARRLCNNGLLPIDAFVILRSPLKRFLYGDGQLNSLIPLLAANRISGRALIPLTPDLCIYFCTKSVGRPKDNVQSMIALNWMVDEINEITQIYSREFLFYRNKPPALHDHFKQAKFLQLRYHSSRLIETLDEVVGKKPSRLYRGGTL